MSCTNCLRSSKISCVGSVRDTEGGRLYGAIRDAGFTITGFSRRMGVHRVSLYRYDRDLETPNESDFWDRAAQLLGVRVEDIAPGDEPNGALAA
jgi:hypothetical protein